MDMKDIIDLSRRRHGREPLHRNRLRNAKRADRPGNIEEPS